MSLKTGSCGTSTKQTAADTHLLRRPRSHAADRGAIAPASASHPTMAPAHTMQSPDHASRGVGAPSYYFSFLRIDDVKHVAVLYHSVWYVTWKEAHVE